MFSKNIRTAYLYIVCFITLMMTAGGLIATVNAVVTNLTPAAVGDAPFWLLGIDPEDQTEEGLAERARRGEEWRVHQSENERRRNIRSMVNSLAVWIVAAPIFIVHQRMVRKEEASDGDSDV